MTGLCNWERVSCGKVGKAKKIDMIQRLLLAFNCYRGVPKESRKKHAAAIKAQAEISVIKVSRKAS